MKNTIRFFALAAVLFSMFAFASCNSNDKKLVGTWKMTDIKESGYSAEEIQSALEMQSTVYTFGEDKTAKVSMEMFGQTIDLDGTYELNGDTLAMTMTYMGQTDTQKMLIVGLTNDELQLGSADGSNPAIQVMTRQ